jgi:hypothetical protein
MSREFILSLLAELDARDLAALAAVCRFFEYTIGELTRRLWTDTFAMWDLEWLNVKFMLSQTESVISGIFSNRLLLRIPPAIVRTSVRLLDIFVWKHACMAVQRYLLLSSRYRFVSFCYRK